MRRAAKRRAKVKGLPFKLTQEWVDSRVNAGVCEISGLPFVYELGGPFQPSIHRIDSRLGYTPENCVMVLWMVNCGIGNYRTEDLVYVARAIAQRHP